MSNLGWTKLATGDAVPSEAIAALDTFKTSLQSIVTIAETVVEIAQTVAEFVRVTYVDLNNLQAEALRAAIQTLRSVIEDLVESTGVYALPVPLRALETFDDTADYYFIGSDDLYTVPPIEYASSLPELASAVKPALGAAGNYGFYATVEDSLNDTNDFMRPQFGPDAHVAAAVLLFGTTSYAEIVALLAKLERLFDLETMGVSLDGGTRPAPSGLRGRVVPAPLSHSDYLNLYTVGDGDVSTNPYAVRLEWEALDRTIALSSFGNDEAEIKKLVIHRWENTSGYTKAQILAGASGGSTKILEEDYDPVGLAYDTTIEAGKTYWYSVGYVIDLVDEDGEVIVSYDTPLDSTAVLVDVPENLRIAPRHGTPPDWIAAPLLSLVPGVSDAVSFLLQWLDTLESSIVTGRDEIEAFIEFLDKELARYVQLAQEISATVSELIDAITFPAAYAGVWIMKPGKGGNSYFLSQLGQALFNPGNANRPPFDAGTEAVTGLVLYTGSGTAGKIDRFVSGVELLFGSMQEQQANALKTAVDELGALDETLAREISITEALIEGVTTEVEPAIGSGLDPSDESSECEAAGVDSVRK